MGSLWINDGALVMENGVLCLNDDCPCLGTGTGTGSSTTCEACTGGLMNGEVEVTISGVFNGALGCTNCADHNGTFALPLAPNAGTSCQWRETWDDLIGSGNGCQSGPTIPLVVQVHYDELGDYHHFTCESSSPPMAYRYPETGELPGTADCLNFDHTFDRTSTNPISYCQWPDTIRVRTR